MERRKAYQDWWRRLPAWLKLVTALCVFPAWFVIVYCVFIGTSQSFWALAAFAVFMVGTLLHIVFDRRNHSGGGERRGIDLFEGD